MEALVGLSTRRVLEVFERCFFKPGEDPEMRRYIRGIKFNTDFHADRIALHRQVIAEMLAELPDIFRASGGHFLDSHVDRQGRQWTGAHDVIEHLVLLGLGTAQLEFCDDRPYWQFMPFGLPYFVVK